MASLWELFHKLNMLCGYWISLMVIPRLPFKVFVIDPSCTNANIYISYDKVKARFLPTSNHLAPLYLKLNISPLLAVVVATGAVSVANSKTAFQAIVLLPVPSWIQTIDINWPVVGLVGASKVTLFVNVTLATGDALTSQSCVTSNVNVASSI